MKNLLKNLYLVPSLVFAVGLVIFVGWIRSHDEKRTMAQEAGRVEGRNERIAYFKQEWRDIAIGTSPYFKPLGDVVETQTCFAWRQWKALGHFEDVLRLSNVSMEQIVSPMDFARVDRQRTLDLARYVFLGDNLAGCPTSFSSNGGFQTTVSEDELLDAAWFAFRHGRFIPSDLGVTESELRQAIARQLVLFIIQTKRELESNPRWPRPALATLRYQVRQFGFGASELSLTQKQFDEVMR